MTRLIEARGVVKYAYDDDGRKLRGTNVQLISDVSMELESGEIHALIGENGAGKTTLIKVLAGAIPQDGGQIVMDGKAVTFSSTKQAREHGISVIWQEFMLAPRLTVAENVFLGRELYRAGRLDKAEMHRQTITALEPLGLTIDPSTPVEKLSTSQQQIVEIAKAVSEHAQVLILDEPTASLSRYETERLFNLLRQLRADGIGIILVTHRFDEVFEMADRVTVMKDGLSVGTYDVKDVTPASLIELMVGHKMASQYAKSSAGAGRVVLQVEQLVVTGAKTPVSLDLHAGEIVGLAGLVGAGRTELARAVVGADPQVSGVVRLDGRDVSHWTMRRRLDAGMAFVPEDRKTQGVITSLSVQRNLAMASWPQLGAGPTVSERAERDMASKQVTDLRIVLRSLGQLVSTLSGGNQQKVAVGKWLTRERLVYILDEPTRGVDVAARQALYELMVAIVEKGSAILMISSDLPEVLSMSDRIYVLRNGEVSAQFTRAEATEQQVLAAMFPDAETVSAP